MRFRKNLLFLVSIIVFTASGSYAQTIERGREASTGTVNFSVLAAYELAHPVPLVRMDIEDDDADFDIPFNGELPDSILSRISGRPRRAYVPTTPVPLLPTSPAPADTFQSTLDNGTLIPPDTHGGVDSNYCLTAINQSIKIQNRTGGGVSTVSLNGFFSSINPTNGTFDPRAHYDPYTNRWFIVCVSGANNVSDSTSILIGVSKTSNPTGAWWLYKVRAYTPGGYWLDYPDVGFNTKWLTVTGNLFQNSPGTTYLGARWFAFNKANLMSGAGATFTAATMTSSDFTVCPALTYDATTPNMFLVENWNSGAGAVKLWKLSGAVGSETMTSISFPISPLGGWSFRASGGVDFAPQLGTANKVQTNDARVTQMVYMNGKLWFAHTVFYPSGGTPTRSAVQWWQIDTGSSATVNQIGKVDDGTGANFYAFPSIAVNTSNDALIGFSAFSATTYPSAAYAMRVHTDAADSLRPPFIYRHGQNSYYKTFSGAINRWGDYSGTCLDPINQNDFWTIQEASSSTVNVWDTWWAHVLTPCTPPASISGTPTVCTGATTTLTDATAGGTWSSSTTSVATVGSSTGVVTGVSAGTTTITYSMGSTCISTLTVTVNTTPGAISGTASICTGSTTTLSSSPSGGTWTSGSTGVATVGSTSGVVSGVSAGTAVITYTLSGGCFATKAVTVSTTPGAITGTASVCTGATTTLSSSSSGGTWTSGSTSIATVGSTTGVVSGVSAGTAVITYTLSGGCFVTQVVTVNTQPSAITGTATVCTGATTTLSSASSGGTWTSGSTGVATVGSTTGVVSGVSAGAAVITYTLSGGCFVTQAVTVNTQPSAITGTTAVCIGSTTTLSSSPTGGTWTSGSTGVATVGSTTGVVSGVSAGTAVITYTLSGGCFVTQSVTVNTQPGAITGTASVCTGSTTTLSSSPTGGTWTSGSTGVATVGSTTGVVSGVSAGTAVITYILSGGCFVTQTVTVNTQPAAITGTATVCTTLTTTLSSSPGGGTWTSGSTGVATVGSTTGFVSGVSAGTAVITYTLSGGCFATKVVTVNTQPSPIFGSATLCTGSTTTYVSSPTGGTWTSGSTGIATVGSSTGVVSGVSAGTSIITYTLSGGCFVGQVVTVSTAPSSITGTASVCTGSTTTLSSSSTGGTWTSGNAGVATVGSTTGVVSGVSAGTAVITYTLSGGCFVTQAVTVNTQPSAITGTASVCTGSTNTLSSSPTGGTWTSGGTGIATVGSSTGVVSGVTAGTAVITYTLSGGCFATQAVTVNAAPSAITGTASICTGSTNTLSSSPTGGTWTSGSTGIATVGSSTGVVSGVSAGTAVITYTLSGGCFATQAVTVTAAPSAITGTASVCTGSTTTLSSSPTGGTWTSGSTGIATVGSSTGVVSGVSAGTAVITYTLSGGCFATQAVTVTAAPSAITGIASVCTGSTTTLSSSPTGGTWASGSTGIATVGSSTGVVSGVSAGTAVITYTLSGGCFVTQAVTVTAAPSAITGTASICTGSTTTLSSSPTGGIWTSGSTGIATVGSSTGVVSGVSAGTAVITYTLSGGCFVTQAVTINTQPSAITGTASLCTGSTTTLSSSPTGGTWTSGSTAVATVVSSTGVVTGVSAGTAIITYTLSGGCSSATTVTVNSVAPITGSTVVCVGSTSTLNSATPGGTWSSSNTAVATIGSSTGDVFGLTLGTSDITYAVGTGCIAVTTVTVNNTSGTITGTTSLCAGMAATLSSSPSGGIWTSSNTAVAIIGSVSGVVNGIATGTTNITYTLPAGCMAVTVVTVNTSAGTILGVAGVCTGSTSTLSSTTPGGVWTSGSPAFATIGASSGLVTGISPGFTLVTYSVGAGCSSSVTVTINPVPAIVSVTGGGNYCLGGPGVNIGLSGSAVGINYQLYRGGLPVGVSFPGVGSILSFGLKTIPGVYTVIATDPVTLCTRNMSGSATVGINPLPAAFSVTGGGSYCSGGTGVAVGLSGSVVGVNYQLYLGGAPIVGTIVPGTGAPISFGLRTTSGVYTVVATDAGPSACTNVMTGSATIGIDALPTAYTVTGGGSYCTGGTGVHIGISNTDVGINYQLYLGASALGAPVAGTGSSIDFGLFTTAGIYTVVATNVATTCVNNMSGSVSVSISSLPTVFAVTGGGSYCSGGSGVAIGLSASTFGVSYQLYSGGSPVGSPVGGVGSALSFGLVAVPGTYTVVAINLTTGCTNTMSGSATVSVIASPAVFTVTGGGSYCTGGSGVAVGLSGSVTGVSYQLYRGATTVGLPVSGTGGSISYGLLTIAGTYTVVAYDPLTGCYSNMTGSAVVVSSPLPTIFTVTGGGAYCDGGSGVHIGLTSSNTGVNYQLYRSGTPVGSPLAGSGAALDFGLFTTIGTYYVVATDAVTGCSSTMSGTAVVSTIALPTAYSVTGGGSYCTGGAGVAVGLAGSQTGVNYQLYLGGSPVGAPLAGTGAALSFGLQAVVGVYTVVATQVSTGCINTMTGSATIVAATLPAVYTVTGGGSYCAGGSGVPVGLSNSATGVNYQLYRGGVPTGSPVAGTGSAISFGLQTVSGSYTVVATDVSSGCTSVMSGSVTVVINAVPTIFAVTGGGGYCLGGTGVHVGLAGSAIGVDYQLYLGGTPVGSPIPGAGSALDFGSQTAAGTYTATAYDPATTCSSNMSGSATINVYSLPVAYTVTGGGAYCSGGTGVAVGLSSSDLGISYQLYLGGTPLTGLVVSGTGSAITFGLQTVAGVYTVVATNGATTCSNTMSGSAVISVNPLPAAYTVTGGGGYCAGGTGVHIGLSNSDAGVNYQLFLGGSPVGSPIAGTGAALDFGLITTSGTYTVSATDAVTGCVSNMTGSAVVTINPLPVSYTVTGGGSYCIGGTGVVIGLSNSQVGVNYQLYLGGSPVGSPVAGTGSSLSFGSISVAGTYTVTAINAATSCTNNMTGSAIVVVNTLPGIYTITGGGSYCSGGTGVPVGLAGSDPGVNYQLFRGLTAVGSPVAGTGSAISFGTHTIAGVYTVVATNASTACVNNMSGTATISINPLPGAIAMTGGGSYCAGGTGVHIGLAGSAVGINYQLWLGGSPVGAPVAGTGSALDFGLFTTAGTYTATAIDPVTLCSSNMSGSVLVAISATPTVYTVTGGGGYCVGGTGVTVGLSNSNIGVTYQLYRGGVLIVGSVLSGSGGALSFGLQTIAGTYTVVATGVCSATMSGSALVSVITAPTAFTVTDGGAYCTGGTGVHVGLSGSVTGDNYQLFRGTTAVGSPVAGTGAALDFGLFTTIGTYTVTATSSFTGCTGAMSGSVSISTNPLPAAFTVGGGGSYCVGGTGVAVTLSGSVSGVTYQLFRGATAVGTPITGTGAPLNFGLQTVAGTYTVVATTTTTGCSNTMTGSATVSTVALPTVFAMTGGGSFCSGGTGVHVGLSGSVVGVNYQLFRGTTAVGASRAGTGAAIDFGLMTTAGTYTAVATVAGSACTANMTGTAVVSVSSLPTTFNVTGGGSYCTGGVGVHIGLNNSTSGVSYQLKLGTTSVGAPLAGGGGALDFGLITVAGTYTVIGTNVTTGCSATMSRTAIVTVVALPVIYTVTGGGNYCSGGSGVAVGLPSSQVGVNYQLFRGTTAVGTSRAGTGGAITFGLQTVAGTYTVVATTSTGGCTNNMSGSATITVNALPVAFTVTGGGSFCSGGSGVPVGLSGSATGVNYQLFRGSTAVGSPVAGTGSAISFGIQSIGGTYTVRATNATTGCTATMTGSVLVSVGTLPAIVAMTGGGGYCSGSAGVHIGLAASAVGVNYQLYLGTTPVGSPVAGGGTALDFGVFTTAGTYTATGTFASTSCSSNMSGTATVTIYTLPTAYSVTGGGSYCSGGTGVHIGISGSNTGITYRVFLSGSPVTASISGTGAAIDFGSFTTAGTYNVVATNAVTGCTMNMTGTAVVSVDPLPTISGSIFTVAPASTITLTGSPAGGSWASSNTAVATVGTSSGIVTGVSLGTTNITYTLPTGCWAARSIAVTATGFRTAPSGTLVSSANSFNETIRIMPNPNKGEFVVTGALTNQQDEEIYYELTDVLGKVIYSNRSVAHNGEIAEMIRVPNVANGMYLFRLSGVTCNGVFHVVIEQ